MSERSRVRLAGATALVTGASGGLGQAIARALARNGAAVILSGRRESELTTLAAETGGRALVADLAVRGDLDRLIEAASGVDILIANAALPATGLLQELTRDEIDRVLEINLRAPIILAKSLSPGMAARGGGHVVLVSSLAGKATAVASSMYSATKFGLRGFGLALRQDLARERVGVSVITPGFIREAGMFHDAGARLPLGVGTRSPDDVAAAVLRAIREDRAEVDVAPAAVRVGAAVAGLAPGLAARASGLLGTRRVATELARGQSDKR